MRTFGSLSLVAVCVVAFACSKPAATPDPSTAAAAASGYPMGYPQPGATAAYPQPVATGYPQAPAGYPQAAPTGYPQAPGAVPGAAPAVPGAAPTAPLATPGPLALPCTSDSACGLAHCNTQFGKCAFPCAAATDCISGAQCNTMTGLCLPGGTAH